jgi:hypothetical protein
VRCSVTDGKRKIHQTLSLLGRKELPTNKPTSSGETYLGPWTVNASAVAKKAAIAVAVDSFIVLAALYR